MSDIENEIPKARRGRPPKEKVEKEKLRIHKYNTEDERKEGLKKARAKYNEKKLYSVTFVCECGETITVGNKSRHIQTVRHKGLIAISRMS